MAKIQIKSEKLTPFGGIFSIMEQFDSTFVRTEKAAAGNGRCAGEAGGKVKTESEDARTEDRDGR